jgi:hypothetical protein
MNTSKQPAAFIFRLEDGAYRFLQEVGDHLEVHAAL